jgi:3-dehydroquinate synthase
MKKIKVLKGKNSYYVISATFEQFFREIARKGLFENILYVIDENVFNKHGERITKLAGVKKNGNNIFIMPSGEKNKSVEQYYNILSHLSDNNYGRDSLISAIGGGVTGDIAGFAASTYMRGIQLVHVPTTLLAMVDSSIGGKTGINFNDRKNIVGTFYQPEFVLVDYSFLNTLPESELLSGAGEILKYAYLADKHFYSLVSDSLNNIIELNEDTLEKIIPVCIDIKANIVTVDEKESGIRKVLNLGHTFAHAYESYFNFKIKHGNAVAAGIISSLYLSYLKGIINKTALDYFLKLPLKLNIQFPGEIDIEAITNRMYSDKKNKDGRIRFVLVKDIGEILIDTEATEEEIRYALTKTFELIK